MLFLSIFILFKENIHFYVGNKDIEKEIAKF
jgi:hypothetical protein